MVKLVGTGDYLDPPRPPSVSRLPWQIRPGSHPASQGLHPHQDPHGRMEQHQHPLLRDLSTDEALQLSTVIRLKRIYNF